MRWNVKALVRFPGIVCNTVNVIFVTIAPHFTDLTRLGHLGSVQIAADRGAGPAAGGLLPLTRRGAGGGGSLCGTGQQGRPPAPVLSLGAGAGGRT